MADKFSARIMKWIILIGSSILIISIIMNYTNHILRIDWGIIPKCRTWGWWILMMPDEYINMAQARFISQLQFDDFPMNKPPWCIRDFQLPCLIIYWGVILKAKGHVAWNIWIPDHFKVYWLYIPNFRIVKACEPQFRFLKMHLFDTIIWYIICIYKNQHFPL